MLEPLGQVQRWPVQRPDVSTHRTRKQEGCIKASAKRMCHASPTSCSRPSKHGTSAKGDSTGGSNAMLRRISCSCSWTAAASRLRTCAHGAPAVSAIRTTMHTGGMLPSSAHHTAFCTASALELAWGLAAALLRGFGALGVTLSVTAAAMLALRLAGVTAGLGLGGDADGCGSSSSCSSSASSKPSGSLPVVCCRATENTARCWCCVCIVPKTRKRKSSR